MSHANRWVEPKDSHMKTILQNAKNVAIVGISNKPERPSNDIAQYLALHSAYRLFFVNPMLETFMGQKVYSSLGEIPEQIDIVDVFRKAEDLPPLFQEAYLIHPKVIWLQLGIFNETLASEATHHGIDVVMDHCIKIEHRRLLGSSSGTAERL